MAAKKKTSQAPLLALPDDPLAGIDILISYYDDPTAVPLVEVGHAALHILAYGYGQFDAHPKTLAKGPAKCDPACPDCCDKVASLALLKEAKIAFEAGDVEEKGMGAIPWATLLQFVMQLLLKLFPLTP